MCLLYTLVRIDGHLISILQKRFVYNTLNKTYKVFCIHSDFSLLFRFFFLSCDLLSRFRSRGFSVLCCVLAYVLLVFLIFPDLKIRQTLLNFVDSFFVLFYTFISVSFKNSFIVHLFWFARTLLNFFLKLKCFVVSKKTTRFF